MHRKLLALVAALFLTTLVTSPAFAANSDVYDKAAAGLAHDPVYIAPNADAQVTEDELNDLSKQIKGYGIPLYIAILPESAISQTPDGTVDTLPDAVGLALKRTAVYGVVAGHNFRANSNGALPSGRTREIADNAFDDESPAYHDGEIYPLLHKFVQEVDYALHPEDRPKTNWGLIGIIIGSIVGGILLIALLLWAITSVVARRREAAERAASFASRKAKAEAWYARLLDDVTSLGNPTDSVTAGHVTVAGEALSRGDTIVGTAKTENDLANAESEFVTANSEVQAANDRENKRHGVETYLKRVSKQVDNLSTLTKASSGDAGICRENARTALGRANEAFTANDYDAAQDELNRAQAQALDCEAYCSGRDPVKEREDAERERQRLAALEAERRRKAAEERAAEEKRRKELAASVKPTKFKPRKARSATHTHYYDGGFYRGRYFGPGYYTDPFWNWVVMDAVLDSSRSYDHGGSYDNSPPPVHHHSSSSYSSHSSSSSSSSSSSGFDFGGGGGSWGGGGGGGGGFDSGGSGGGSW